MHASPTAKGVFLAKFDLSGAFTFILFPKSLSRVFLVLSVAYSGSCVGLQNKSGHPAHRHRRLMQTTYDYVPNHVLLCVIIVSQRYVMCGLQSASVFLRGLKIVCCSNFHVS